MTDTIEFKSGQLAVVTGGGSGIGLAAAHYLARQGMKLAIIDQNLQQLNLAVKDLSSTTHVVGYHTDVSDAAAMQALPEKIEKEFGPLSVLFANAGIQPGSQFFAADETWRRVIEVNFWGVVNTVSAFQASMLASSSPSQILITGSKQGITTPPGDPAYNVSKAAVKVYAEALAHEVRNRSNCKTSVHLIVPGFVWTPLTYAGRPEMPKGAWTADQMVEFAMASVRRGDFYILCPDNDVDRALDEKRIAWAAGDIIENRPPLSRWHKDYADAFLKRLKD